eukprot:4247684-Amphidinium_carterae.1
MKSDLAIYQGRIAARASPDGGATTGTTGAEGSGQVAATAAPGPNPQARGSKRGAATEGVESGPEAAPAAA